MSAFVCRLGLGGWGSGIFANEVLHPLPYKTQHSDSPPLITRNTSLTLRLVGCYGCSPIQVGCTLCCCSNPETSLPLVRSDVVLRTPVDYTFRSSRLVFTSVGHRVAPVGFIAIDVLSFVAVFPFSMRAVGFLRSQSSTVAVSHAPLAYINLLL